MKEMFCNNPSCIGWRLNESDVFCSYCGSKLRRFSLSLERKSTTGWEKYDNSFFYPDSQPELRLLIEHSGQVGIIKLDKDSIHVESGSSYLKLSKVEPVELNPGKKINIPFEFKKVENENEYHTIRIQVRYESEKHDVSLDIVPRPSFELLMLKDTIVVNSESAAGYIRIVKGVASILKTPEMKQDKLKLIFSEETHFPYTIDPRSGIDSIPFGVSLKDTMPVDSVTPKEFTIKIHCSGREDTPVELLHPLHVLFPPELSVQPFIESDRYRHGILQGIDENREIEIKLRNGDNKTVMRQELSIEKIEALVSSDESSYKFCPWIIFPKDIHYPLTIANGESAVIKVSLDCALLPEGHEVAELIVYSDVHPKEKHYFLDVTYSKPELHDGALAIDFGTTNSCCAVTGVSSESSNNKVDKGENLHNLKLIDIDNPKHNTTPTTVPSAILYKRLIEQREYDVGAYPYTFAFTDIKNESATVLRIKRHAGDKNKLFKIIPLKEQLFQKDFYSKEIISDIYEFIIRKASQKIRKSFNRFVITHPSRFSLAQIDSLREACHDAAQRCLKAQNPSSDIKKPDIMIKTLHEPVAAALDFLSDWRTYAVIHERKNIDNLLFHAVICDFGGGTIDITLMKVESERVKRTGKQLEGNSLTSDDNNRTVPFTLKEVSTILISHTDEAIEAVIRTVLKRCRSNIEKLYYSRRTIPMTCSEQKPNKIETEAGENNLLVIKDWAQSFVSFLAEILQENHNKGDNTSAIEEHLLLDPKVESLFLKTLRREKSETMEFKKEDILVPLKEILQEIYKCSTFKENTSLTLETPEDYWKKYPYGFRASCTTLGAMGQRWFGGEDVTEIFMSEMLHNCEKHIRELPDNIGRKCHIPLNHENLRDPKLKRISRLNSQSLWFWAENVKKALVDSKGNKETAASSAASSAPLTLKVLVDSSEIPFPSLAIPDVMPTLETIKDKLHPHFKETIELIETLLKNNIVEIPDFVILVGQSSKIPQFKKMVTEAFPHTLVSMPKDLKECVVRGASSPQIQSAVIRMDPGKTGGLLFEIDESQNMSATTSRLGVEVLIGYSPQFLEIIGAGKPIPSEGLKGTIEGMVLRRDHNHIRILENSGLKDDMFQNGQENPDIAEIRRFIVKPPSHLSEYQIKNASVIMVLSPEMRISLKVRYPEGRNGEKPEEVQFEQINPEDMPGGY